MDMVKFGLTIAAIVLYLAVHLAKVWREQKEQEAKKASRPSDEKIETAEKTEVDRRVAEAQQRRREQQQQAALAAAGLKPRIAKKAIPIQVVAASAPKTRITYSQPAAKAPAKLPEAPKAPPVLAASLGAQAGLGAVATVAKRPVSPALAQLAAMLKDRNTLAAAFMLKEVFDKPVSQRKV